MGRGSAYSPQEDEIVARRIREGIAQKREIQDVAMELSQEIGRTPGSIIVRWHTYLSDEKDRVVAPKGKMRSRKPWSTRLMPETYALMNAMSDVMRVDKTKLIELALDALMDNLDDDKAEMVKQRREEILGELGDE